MSISAKRTHLYEPFISSCTDTHRNADQLSLRIAVHFPLAKGELALGNYSVNVSINRVNQVIDPIKRNTYLCDNFSLIASSANATNAPNFIIENWEIASATCMG